MVLPAVDADAPGPRTAAPATVYPTIVPEIDIIPFVPDPAPPIRVTPLPGTVALTFDDGPDPDWTPQILDILAEHGAVAT
ncbi:MAG: polysaccharide deacetylase family protein, partial [Actinobacteria bacterium]|nr:polysaccharide deacetylase family protein [Actinomycetota bacterium]